MKRIIRCGIINTVGLTIILGIKGLTTGHVGIKEIAVAGLIVLGSLIGAALREKREQYA